MTANFLTPFRGINEGILPMPRNLYSHQEPLIDEEELRNGINRTTTFFRSCQQPDGHWVAELEGDALLQSETVLLLAFLDEEDSPLARACVERLAATALPEGGWEMYPGAGADVTNSVKGYFALKLTGRDPSDELMRKTRQTILALGGAEKVNSFTRFYLALLGQIPYDQTPAVPPQMMFFPDWFPINIYSMSAWSRTIFVPLSIVSALAPVRKVTPERGIRELMTRRADRWPPLICPGRKLSQNPFSLDRLFRLADRLIWKCRKFGLTPMRKAAVQRAKVWTLNHFRKSDGPGAIYPPIIWAWVAMKALGCADDSPEIIACRKELEALVVGTPGRDSVRVAPCKSPVWDSSLTLKALRLAGVDPEDSMIRHGEDWLVARQTTELGDWRHRCAARPGGWAFEYHNEFYPDNDDTAMALMILAGSFPEGEINRRVAVESFVPPQTGQNDRRLVLQKSAQTGREWLLAMQNKDGGWGAFDKGNTMELLCHVPFADHNAMIDPSTPDLTGRVLESFGRQGYRLGDGHPFLKHAARFMRKEQLPDGSWFGRWGVNYLYGTWQALTGLTAIGVPTDDEAIRAGANWLLAQQQADGGWGESPDSYDNALLKGKGNPTASQTAWAVMGLLAAGLVDHPSTRRGVAFLLNRQRPDGRWDEPEFTGTGFPRVFYLKYHFYSVYFPLMALSIYSARIADHTPSVSNENASSKKSSSDNRSVSAPSPALKIEKNSLKFFDVLARRRQRFLTKTAEKLSLFVPDEEAPIGPATIRFFGETSEPTVRSMFEETRMESKLELPPNDEPFVLRVFTG